MPSGQLKKKNLLVSCGLGRASNYAPHGYLLTPPQSPSHEVGKEKQEKKAELLWLRRVQWNDTKTEETTIMTILLIKYVKLEM